MDERTAVIERKTGETQVKLSLSLDGSGKSTINSGIGFLDHMLTAWTKHASFDLDLQAQGDLEVDDHHTVEDIGICLGLAFRKAVGDKRGINRFGTFFVPMDEALAMISLDISGRSFLEFDVDIKQQKVGSFDTELVEEFFRAFTYNALITLHVKLFHGKNAHHMIEAIFKAWGRALKEAVSFDQANQGIPSTKGIL